MAKNKEPKSILHIYITEEEKEILRQKTKESGCVSLNEYARKRLFTENAVTNMSFNGLFDANTVLDASVERNRIVSTSLSDEEYEFVKKMAGPSTMSAFLRRLILSANTGKFTFDIKVDDLSEVRNALTDFNLRMGGIIGALRYRTELYHSDIEAMERLLAETNENVKKALTVVMTDRKYLRKKGIQHLSEQINKILTVTNTSKEGG